MADTKPLQSKVADPEQVKLEWLARVTALVDTVEGWPKNLAGPRAGSRRT